MKLVSACLSTTSPCWLGHLRPAGASSLSAAIQQTIRCWATPGWGDAYAVAWDEWEASGETSAWEVTATDGFTGAAG